MVGRRPSLPKRRHGDRQPPQQYQVLHDALDSREVRRVHADSTVENIQGNLRRARYRMYDTKGERRWNASHTEAEASSRTAGITKEASSADEGGEARSKATETCRG